MWEVLKASAYAFSQFITGYWQRLGRKQQQADDEKETIDVAIQTRRADDATRGLSDAALDSNLAKLMRKPDDK